jgi:hypothetical protein
VKGRELGGAEIGGYGNADRIGTLGYSPSGCEREPEEVAEVRRRGRTKRHLGLRESLAGAV